MTIEPLRLAVYSIIFYASVCPSLLVSCFNLHDALLHIDIPEKNATDSRTRRSYSFMTLTTIVAQLNEKIVHVSESEYLYFALFND
jgi:hypothetical protein